MRKPLEIPVPTVEELEALEILYRTTRRAATHPYSNRVAGWRAADDSASHCQDCARR